MDNLIPDPQRINNNEKGWSVRSILNGLNALFGDSINKLYRDKVDRSEITNLSVGIKDYKDDVTSIPDLPKTGNAEGDARVVINDKDPNGRSYIWLWNGKSWSRTAFTSFPGDILTQSSLTQQITKDVDKTPTNKAVSEALNLKSSINYFFGYPIVDFDNKVIVFKQGYFTRGKNVSLLEEQSLSYTSSDSFHICLNLANNQWVLQPITETSPLDNHIYVGFVDLGNNDIKGNFRQPDLGNKQRIGKQGFVVGSTFKMKINFNSDSWNISTTTGYLATANGNNLIQIEPQSFDFYDKNVSYVYIDTELKRFVIYSYHIKPKRSFYNLYYLGVINPSDKKVLLNTTGLVIDGKELTQFTKEQSEQLTDSISQLGQSKQSFLPVTGWINKSWNSSLDSDVIFIDSRCFVSSINQLKNIKIQLSKAGTVRIHLLDMNYNLVSHEDKNLAVGLNNIMIQGITYSQTLRIGIQNITGLVQTIMPADNTGDGRRKNISTGEISISNYSYAYELETTDYTNTLFGRINVLEDRYMPTSDDINAILSKQDFVQLQPRQYNLSTPINLKSGQTIIGCGATTVLNLVNGNKRAIQGIGVEGISLGHFTTKGTQADYKPTQDGLIVEDNIIADEDEAYSLKYMGDETAIYFEDSNGIFLNKLNITNITGSAIRCNKVGRDYVKGLIANELFINNCYNGIYGENEHEFSIYSDFEIAMCQIGIAFNSGNLMFSDGMLTKSRVGLMLMPGYNEAHGKISDLEIKHNNLAGIFCKDITAGEMFNGIYLSYSDLIIRNSTGLYFDDLKMGSGNVICTNDKNVQGKNVINSFVRRTANAKVSNTGNLEIMNTINLF